MPVKQKLLIFIVAYNAEKHLRSVLGRISPKLWKNTQYNTEVLIIDDASDDGTTKEGSQYAMECDYPITILRNPVNQGYGGNQKLGYSYAIENGFDIVVLLHGDGQYSPEMIETLAEPINKAEADVVFGSRMINKSNALKGGMPYYKFLGNIVLTACQNKLLGSQITEFHSGYRVYRVAALKKIPFQYNSNDFDFDTDIIIQLLNNQFKIKEVPIETCYGDEKCHVNGVKYALKILRSTLISKVQKFGIYYNPKFDYSLDNAIYGSKTAFDSSHHFAIQEVAHDTTVLDIGCASGYVAKELKQKQCKIYGFDQYISKENSQYFEKIRKIDLDHFDFKFGVASNKIDTVLLLDVIEHLSAPELFLKKLREELSPSHTKIVITTGNVAFIIVRLSMLLGSFNYGKRGILDLTHKRLFTFSSLKRTLYQCGYEIEKVEGIPVPIPFIMGENKLSTCLLYVNRGLIKVWKGLFAYQMAVVARPMPTLDALLERARKEGNKEYIKVKQSKIKQG